MRGIRDSVTKWRMWEGGVNLKYNVTKWHMGEEGGLISAKKVSRINLLAS